MHILYYTGQKSEVIVHILNYTKDGGGIEFYHSGQLLSGVSDDTN